MTARIAAIEGDGKLLPNAQAEGIAGKSWRRNL